MQNRLLSAVGSPPGYRASGDLSSPTRTARGTVANRNCAAPRFCVAHQRGLPRPVARLVLDPVNDLHDTGSSNVVGVSPTTPSPGCRGRWRGSCGRTGPTLPSFALEPSISQVRIGRLIMWSCSGGRSLTPRVCSRARGQPRRCGPPWCATWNLRACTRRPVPMSADRAQGPLVSIVIRIAPDCRAMTRPEPPLR